MDTGRTNWEHKALEYRDITTPVAVSSYVTVGDMDGYLHVMAQSDGRFVGRKRVDSKGLYSAPVVDGARIYTLGNSGRLTALELQ